MIHELFKIFNWLGSEWILFTLIGLSVVSFFVIIQRYFELRRMSKVSARFWAEHAEGWFHNADMKSWQQDFDSLKTGYPCLEVDTLDVIQKSREMKDSDPSRVVEAYLEQRKIKLEKNVSILGTIGSNAPFVGLLGTVLGIIRAFHDMSINGMSQGVESIGGGIAEALVATAVGLLVAIPAVVFFNFLNKRIGILLRRAESIGCLALSQVKKSRSEE